MIPIEAKHLSAHASSASRRMDFWTRSTFTPAAFIFLQMSRMYVRSALIVRSMSLVLAGERAKKKKKKKEP
jgi:hypothetical protein